MSVVVVGLHERDAPLELLESVAISERDLPKALRQLCESPHIAEAVVLSTCLRTEVYAVLERFHDGLATIRQFFEDHLGSPNGLLEEHLVVEFDEAVVRHLFEVASGVDSPVLGEGEILRQVRHAGERAREERASGPVLGDLFRHAIEVGKRVRSDTAIARGITSLAHVAVAVVGEQTGDGLSSKHVVIAGAGEMGVGIAEGFKGQGAAPDITIANRNFERASELASVIGARAVPLASLSDVLDGADVLVSATASEQVLLDVDDVRQIMERRRGRPMLIVDTAMPRDIDPAAGQLEGVSLFDVADLRSFAEHAMESRRQELTAVDSIIEEELDRYETNVRARSAAPVVSSLRAKAETLRLQELDRISSRLNSLETDEREAVEGLTRAIVAKLLHEPTVELKAAAGTARGERLAEALRALFDL